MHSRVTTDAIMLRARKCICTDAPVLHVHARVYTALIWSSYSCHQHASRKIRLPTSY